jgi:hypothetical protein
MKEPPETRRRRSNQRNSLPMRCSPHAYPSTCNREHLILELALLGEQKTAKVIELLEEFRRDNPLIRNRIEACTKMSLPP